MVTNSNWNYSTFREEFILVDYNMIDTALAIMDYYGWFLDCLVEQETLQDSIVFNPEW